MNNQVVGVGDAGISMINRMVEERLDVEFIFIDHLADATEKRELLGADLVFVIAGMGGETGTDAAPIVAEYARDRGASTIGIVTNPFTMEGTARMRTAQKGIYEMMHHTDSVIVISNQTLLKVASFVSPVQEAYDMASCISFHTVSFFMDFLHNAKPALDFADFRRMLSNTTGCIGFGSSMWPATATRRAIRPLVSDVSIASAKELLVKIEANHNVAKEVISVISDATNANITLGFVKNIGLADVRVTAFGMF